MKTYEDGWNYFGEHSIRFEPPDIVYFRPVDHVSFEDAEKFIAWTEKHEPQAGGVYLLSDISRAKSQSGDVIKSKDLMDRIRVFRGLAYFGASFHARTGIAIYLRVARFFKMPLADLPLAFLADEQEARAWIDECRAKAAAKT